ncbi:MAG: DUF4836 family protein [Bacteroidales bacterium]|nr:DUF4836 family protein [Bacteroidales bacterium]
MRKNLLLLSVIALLFAVSSCTEVSRQMEYIPGKTASVISVDYRTMMQKAGPQGEQSATKVLEFFNGYGFSSETFDLAVKTFFSKEVCGVDTASNVVAYLVPSKEFRNSYKCMSVLLSDSAAFSAYLKKNLGERYRILADCGNCVCYENFNDRISWIAYNHEIAVFGSATMHTKGIQECIREIFSTKKSLAKNKDYKTFCEEKYDVGVWLSTSEIIDYYKLWYTELPKWISSNNVSETILRDNYLHINATFDKQVNVSLQCNPGRAFRRFWKKNNFIAKKFDSSICRVLPKHTMWFASFGVDAEKFMDVIEDSDYGAYAKKELAKLNLTLQDVANAFKGDCVFSMYDVSLEKVRAMEFAQKIDKGAMVWKHLQKDQKVTFPHLVVASSLNDSRIPNMVLTHISKDVCEQMAPGLFDFSKIMNFPAYVVCKENVFLFTTDKVYAESMVMDEVEFLPVVSTVNGKTMKELQQNTNDCASYHYMDFTVADFPATMKDYLKEMDVLPLVEQYSSIVKSAEMRLSDSYKGTIVVELQDTTNNSLYQLNSLLNIILP